MTDLFSYIGILVVFSITVTTTPGPNNIMLLSSGVNFGYRRSLPHILGINVGYNLLLLLTGLGLGEVFTHFPIVQTALKYTGSGYLAYLAWRIFKAGRPEAKEGATPLKFYQAFLFQYVNPKAWVMAIMVISGFTDSMSDYSFGAHLFIIILVNILVSLFSASLWTIGGVMIAKILHNNRIRFIFNSLLAIALLGTIYWMVT